MSANLARKGSVLALAGGVYIAACYIGYNAVQRNKADIDETTRMVQDGKFSFVKSPQRNEQYDIVAEKYDDEIGRDESVMGINLLRRSLLYFHAKGTVLEVGAGTGRNIGKYGILSWVIDVLFRCTYYFPSLLDTQRTIHPHQWIESS
jgi:methyltransferase OMS1